MVDEEEGLLATVVRENNRREDRKGGSVSLQKRGNVGVGGCLNTLMYRV